MKTIALIVVAVLALTFGSAEAQTKPAGAAAPATAQCGPTQTTHVVVAGDTCESISRKYYEGRPYLVQLLREVNKLNQACAIKVGQTLVVPTCLNNLGPAPPQPPTVRVVTPRPNAPAPAPVVQTPSVPTPSPITINNNNENVVIIYTPPAPEKKEEAPTQDDSQSSNSRSPAEVAVYRQEPPISPRKPSRFGVTASATVGPIDSGPLSGLINDVARRRVCTTGGMYTIGGAYGDQGSSFWTFTAALKTFDSGSYTELDCKNCGQTMRAVTSGASVWGFNVERNFRIEIKKGSRVQLMVSANGGAGRIRGKVVQEFGPTGKGFTSKRDAEAGAMFGSSVFPFVGGGVGLMGDLGRHLTYTVTAVGVEYPGTYYGRVGITYWP